MVLQFTCTADYSKAPDVYNTIAFTSDSDWLIELAQEYLNLRSRPSSPINEALFDGLGFDSKHIRECFKSAGLPVLPHPIPDFNVVRSDFGELTALMLLEQSHNFTFPYKSIRDRELSHLPGRSIDAIGAKSDPLSVVFNESKVSDEKSKPQVVDKTKDSLSKSLTKHISDHSGTSKKLWDLVRRIKDPALAELFITVALYWDSNRWDKLDIKASAFLVRPKNHYKEADYGNLRKKPTKLRPGKIDFKILCLDGTIDDTIRQFHDKAKELDIDG